MRIKIMLIAFTFAFATELLATEVDDAIKQAKAAQKEAASLGFEWRDTGKIIKKAEAAAKEGKDKKAIELATIIIDQLPAVRKQAAIAKNAGPRF
ncbi:hypothetical protein [Cocleimonas flava]|nr:hypothetical protein [Cocleimonas flava]